MPERLDARTEYIYNHFVPVFYLKYFANESDHKKDTYFTYVTDLLLNKTYPRNIAKIGGEKYLNTVEYEKILGTEYEGRYADTLRKIEIIDRSVKLNLQLPHGYLDDLFDFIAFIYSHNLYSRQAMQTQYQNQIQKIQMQRLITAVRILYRNNYLNIGRKNSLNGNFFYL